MDKLRLGLLSLFLVFVFLTPALPALDSRHAPISHGEEFRFLLEEARIQLDRHDYGRAALALEKSLVLTDAYPPVQVMLDRIRAYTEAKRFDLKIHPFVEALFFLYYSCSRTDLVRLMLISLALLFFFSGLGLFRSLFKKTWLRITLSLLVFFLLASCGAFLYHLHEAGLKDRAIVLEPAGLFASASDEESMIVELPPATSIRILKLAGDWYQVALPGGAKGWLAGSKVGRIN